MFRREISYRLPAQEIASIVSEENDLIGGNIFTEHDEEVNVSKKRDDEVNLPDCLKDNRCQMTRKSIFPSAK